MYLLEVQVKLVSPGMQDTLNAKITHPVTTENLDQVKATVDSWFPSIIGSVREYLENELTEE